MINMIMFPRFIEACTLTCNAQLVYILLKLSYGEEFVYNTYKIYADKTHVYIKHGNEIHKFNYGESELNELLLFIQKKIHIGDIQFLEIKTLPDFLIKYYVIDKIPHELSFEEARVCLKKYLLGRIFKTINSKDIHVKNYRISDITYPSSSSYQPHQKRQFIINRMDNLFTRKQ